MKELDVNKLVKEKQNVEVTQQKEVEYRLEYESTIIPHENHTLFEINIDTLEVSIPEYKVRDYVYNPHWVKGSKIQGHSEVIRKEGFAYISALNKKNALKKYKEGSNGSKLDPNGNYLEL